MEGKKEDIEIDEAITCFDRAIGLDADHASAWYNRGIAYHIRYQPEPGCTDLRTAADLGPAKALDALTYFCPY